MEPKVFTNRLSLAGSAAREAEADRAQSRAETGAQAGFEKRARTDVQASSFRIQPGSAARAAEAARAEVAQRDGGMGLNLRAGGPRATPARLFPGPSARPSAVTEPVTKPFPEPSAVALSVPRVQVQQAPHPDSPQPGTATSIGARFKHTFQSFFHNDVTT